VNGIISVIIPAIKSVVDDDSWIVIVTQRAPGYIVIPTMPMYPGRSPISGRYPIPAKTDSPVPTAIMGNAPSPGLIRDPSPSTDGIPDPPALIIRSPRVMVDIGNPDISIGTLVHPTAVIGQFGLILIQF